MHLYNIKIKKMIEKYNSFSFYIKMAKKVFLLLRIPNWRQVPDLLK